MTGHISLRSFHSWIVGPYLHMSKRFEEKTHQLPNSPNSGSSALQHLLGPWFTKWWLLGAPLLMLLGTQHVHNKFPRVNSSQVAGIAVIGNHQPETIKIFNNHWLTIEICQNISFKSRKTRWTDHLPEGLPDIETILSSSPLMCKSTALAAPRALTRGAGKCWYCARDSKCDLLWFQKSRVSRSSTQPSTLQPCLECLNPTLTEH